MSNRGRGKKPPKKRGYDPPDDVFTTATLTEPVTIMGEEVTVLKYRKARFRDVRDTVIADIAKMTFGEAADLTETLANATRFAAGDMATHDAEEVFRAVMECVLPFDESEEEDPEKDPEASEEEP